MKPLSTILLLSLALAARGGQKGTQHPDATDGDSCDACVADASEPPGTPFH